MAWYKVRITANLETSTIIEAENEEEAGELAENEFGGTYVVLNTETDDYIRFTDIIGYEPEEVKNDNKTS
jgi:hypothetical protein